jgi:hypothetical protein
VEENDSRALDVHEFLSRSMARYAEKVTSALAGVKPNLAFVFTHFSLEGRYLSTQAGIQNWSFMATRGNGWGDYSLRDPSAFRHEAATLLAHGGRPYLSDDNYPSGNPDPAVYRVYSDINQRTRQLEPIAEGCEPVRDIAVLLCEIDVGEAAAHTAREWMSGPASPGVAGAHKTLIEAHAQFGILNSDTLVERLGEYKALIVPE